MAELSIGAVVVTYNSAHHIRNCLVALRRHCEDIVVVDNGSRDETVAIVNGFPGVQLLVNSDNRGFASAVNRGFARLEKDAVLLLNPDTVLWGGLDRLRTCLEDPRTGVAAGLLLSEDSTPQTGFSVRRFPGPITLAFETLGLNRLFPSNPINRRYRCLDVDLSKVQSIEQPAGAFLLIRRSVWAEIGGFDESFFPLWYEDVDFLKRVAGRGYRIILQPAALATHSGGHSLESLTAERRRWYWYVSLLRYSAKHFGFMGFRLVCGAVAIGAAARTILAVMTEDDDHSTIGDFRVMWFAVRRLLGGRRWAAPAYPQHIAVPSKLAASSQLRSGQPNVL
jgi:GT2 family glycosyltransferase